MLKARCNHATQERTQVAIGKILPQSEDTKIVYVHDKVGCNLQAKLEGAAIWALQKQYNAQPTHSAEQGIDPFLMVLFSICSANQFAL